MSQKKKKNSVSQPAVPKKKRWLRVLVIVLVSLAVWGLSLIHISSGFAGAGKGVSHGGKIFAGDFLRRHSHDVL